ncbi:MAG: type II secretion system F family protein [Erysipelotrichaceae bacterium]|nr:type II secretion system F family protein [Erysipelotrichaceae bacterium]
MPTYKYSALSKDRNKVNGVIEAYDELAAVDIIKEKYPIVLSVEEASVKPSILETEIGPKKIPLKQLSILCSEFAIVLKAGMPIARASGLMAEQTEDKKIKKLLTEVTTDVSNGYSLADSFENKGSEYLPATFIETVRAGESSGTLDTSFDSLKTYFENQSVIQEKVKSALTYPIFLLVLSAVVIAIVLGVAMPVFTDLFAEFDIEMPLITRIVMAIANFFSSYWFIILLAIVLIAIAIRYYASTEQGHINLSKMQTQFPLLKEVIQMKSASQFANTMATLLNSGLPMIRAVNITSKVLDNYYMGLKLGSTINKLEEGRSLGECLEETECYPKLLCEMVAMGEETGSLEETLKTIGLHFDNEVSVATKRMLDMLQPAITVVLGIVIGFIVIALYMPMFTLYGGI